jgi:hypothetical protein
MTDKAKLQAVSDKLAIADNLDPFSPENLRLSQAFAEITPVKKELTTVPVRKPRPQDWVRVHPSPDYHGEFAMLEFKDEKEEYCVSAPVQLALASETVCKRLQLAINRQGTLFFWPTRLPTADGRDMDWWRSGREAAEMAMTHWVRVKANTNLGAYEIFKAQAEFGEPEWPDLSFWELIKIAFRDHLIDSLDHPVVKRLRGLA